MDVGIVSSTPNGGARVSARGHAETWPLDMRIAHDLSMSQVRKAGKTGRSAARPGSPGVDLAERGWGPTVVPGANVATLVPWVPESDWPLPLSQPMGWQNGPKRGQNGDFCGNMLRYYL